jgi:hypothetical protein
LPWELARSNQRAKYFVLATRTMYHITIQKANKEMTPVPRTMGGGKQLRLNIITFSHLQTFLDEFLTKTT